MNYRTHIVKILILPKLNYNINVISVTIQAGLISKSQKGDFETYFNGQSVKNIQNNWEK